MYVADQWQDYEVLDCGDGEKLERWGKYVLCRPDPQVIWPQADPGAWSATQARYLRSDRGGGSWQFMEKLPERWQLSYKGLRFLVHPTGFKHTGLFPEQAANWDWMRSLIAKSGRNIRVLNLFAYTGGATIACAAQGAHVTHVDAAKGMVQWAKENRSTDGSSQLRQGPERRSMEAGERAILSGRYLCTGTERPAAVLLGQRLYDGIPAFRS